MKERKNEILLLGAVLAGVVTLNWLLQHPAVALGALGALGSLLTPFFVGGAVAFVLNVPMRAIERRMPERWGGARRKLALRVTVWLVVGVLAAVVLLLIPSLRSTFVSLSEAMPIAWARAQTWLTELQERFPLLEQLWPQVSSFQGQDLTKGLSQLLAWMGERGTALVGGAANAASGLVGGIADTAVGVVFAFYLLCQKERLGSQLLRVLRAYLPDRWTRRILRVAALTEKTFSAFLSGQCLEACILGCMFALSMLICRMPYAPLISLVIAVTALIPIFGSFLGCAVGVLLILTVNPGQALWFIVLFLCLQQIEGNFIYPRVVGNSVGLPAIWVLAAVTLGGRMFGVLGMLVMIPACSVAYALLRQGTERRLRRKRILKQEP